MNTSWKIGLAATVIFAAGAVTGGLIGHRLSTTRITQGQHAAALAKAEVAFSPGYMRLDLLRRMCKDLDLTPLQKQRTEKIIKESQENLREITAPVAPEILEEIEQAKEAFLEILTPAQHDRYEQLLKQQQQRVKDMKNQLQSGKPQATTNAAPACPTNEPTGKS